MQGRGGGGGVARKQTWEDELSERYSEYNELLPELSPSSRGRFAAAAAASDALDISLPNMDMLDMTKRRRNGAERFPPKSRIDIPSAIDERMFVPTASLLSNPSANQKLGADLFENVNFMEKLIVDILGQLCPNRDACRTHGAFLYSLPFPPHDADLKDAKRLVKELTTLRDEAISIGNDLDDIRLHRVDAVLPSEISSANPLLSKVRQGIVKRCEALRAEASTTEMVLHNLLDLADDLSSVHQGQSCKLDGVEPDWKMFEQQAIRTPAAGVKTSNKALCYVAWMEARGLPICDAAFEFFQSPTQNDHTLAIVGYIFAPRELCELLEYVCSNGGRTPIILSSLNVNEDDDEDVDETKSDTQNLYEALKTPVPLYLSNTVHQLVLDECELSDYDMNTIATHLPALTGLHTLCLRGNNVSSLGATSLSTALWDRALELKTLRLDRNSIGAEGALSISKAIHRCRYLQSLSLSFNPMGDVGMFYILRSILNPVRRARNDLPRPFQLSKKDGDYDFDDEIESVYSDDEDVMQRILRRRREEEEGGGEWKGDDHTGGMASDDDDSDNEFDFGSKISRGDDDSTDVYTMPREEESVYSVAMSRRSSVQLNPSAAGQSLSRISSRFDPSALARLSLFLRKFRRVRFKIIAVAAFQRIKSRGHGLYSLSVAGCNLSSFSLRLVAHALTDNHNVGALDMSQNPVGVEDGGVDNDNARTQELLQEQHEATHVLGVAQHQLGLNRKLLRAAIQSRRQDVDSGDGEGRYDALVYELSAASGVHAERLETVVFPVILRKEIKEVYSSLLCGTGLQTLSLRSCGLRDDAVQQLVQICNKGAGANQRAREGIESCAMAILRDRECVRNPQLNVILREHSISLALDDDVHHHSLLVGLDKTDLDQIAATLKARYQKPFLQSLQRKCCITTLDLSENHLGPTAANWVASATGQLYLDDLQLSVGYVSRIALPRKNIRAGQHRSGGHSRRALQDGDASFDDDDQLSEVSAQDYPSSPLRTLTKALSSAGSATKDWMLSAVKR